MTDKPLVSVIMGVYNCADTLNEAIDSIINQTYAEWVFIICDDGSTDASYSIAMDYAKRYPEQFIVIKNERNMGLNYTLNRCLNHVKTEFVARMDGDDISLPERFEKLLEAFDKEPDLAVVSSAMKFFDENGIWGECGAAYEYPQPEQLIKASAHFHAPSMLRTDVIKAVGGYTIDKRLLRVEDRHLWLKIYSNGWRGKNLSEALYMVRDDREAKQRRNFRARINGVYVTSLAIRTLHLKKRNYIYAIRPLLVWMLPNGIYDLFLRKTITKRHTI